MYVDIYKKKGYVLKIIPVKAFRGYFIWLDVRDTNDVNIVKK